MAAENTSYALITADKAPLLREAGEPTFDNTYFILPQNFFVTMVQPHDTNGYHKVRYRDIVGYVSISDVDVKSYTPISIFPDTVTLKLNLDADGVYLRSRPDHLASQVVYRIPSDTKTIEYYNYTEGTDALGIGNRIWYYVKIPLGDESSVRGYLYGTFVLLNSEIPLDNDTSPVIAPPAVLPETTTPQQKLDPIRLTGIIALCIPAVVIVILIFIRPKKKPKIETVEKYSS